MYILEKDPSKIYFTADHHFGHANIIKYCNRPFNDVDEMDASLTHAWYKVMRPDTTVFHLGDLTLGGSCMKYLPTQMGKLHYMAVYWHHDKRWLAAEGELLSRAGLMNFIPPIEVLQFPNIFADERFKITVSHYPMAEWEASHYDTWHLHAHSHGNYTDRHGRAVYDVGVDNNAFAPVSLYDLINIMGEKGFTQPLKGFETPRIYH